MEVEAAVFPSPKNVLVESIGAVTASAMLDDVGAAEMAEASW